MGIWPAAVSLMGVQRELEETKAFSELEAKIRLAMKTQSCHSDMKEASDCLTALNAIRASARGWNSRNRDTTESALFRMAIMLYARATITNTRSGERGPIQIDKRLTPEQLIDHEAILNVRNQAQAHVYPNQEVADQAWHRAEVFLIEFADGWLPSAASNRILVAPSMLVALNRQIPVALTILAERSRDRLGEVAAALVRGRGTALNQLMGRHSLDLVQLFGSEDEAKRVLDSARNGNADWVTTSR